MLSFFSPLIFVLRYFVNSVMLGVGVDFFFLTESKISDDPLR